MMKKILKISCRYTLRRTVKQMLLFLRTGNFIEKLLNKMLSYI